MRETSPCIDFCLKLSNHPIEHRALDALGALRVPTPDQVSQGLFTCTQRGYDRGRE
jgi:hypothetical protein